MDSDTNNTATGKLPVTVRGDTLYKITATKGISFEVFPPKKNSAASTVLEPLKLLASYNPSFISVTYSAAGSENSAATVNIASHIQDAHKIPSVAHLTCLNSDKDNIRAVLAELSEKRIFNILALRGDRVDGVTPKTDFAHASDLISFIRAEYGDRFCVGGACYPEGHTENLPAADLANLKRKADSGADFLVSQLFFENGYFYDFLDRARAININVPIYAGVMPVTSVSQIQRMVTMCGASLPRKLSRLFAKYEGDADGFKKAMLGYSVAQVAGLIAAGVDGVHLYTMNKPDVAKVITDAVKGIL
ncbi:MAG: methylenetetrahydrofolate reductase [Oscillospiraceae bacterium]|jgi:methylenetetrahydrofolate reductase (NADPH)|nr:methylenetetrahydrofolate reductase [Oscillospiraceae bacterium]